MAEATSSAVGANPMDAYTTFLLGQLFNYPNNNALEKVQGRSLWLAHSRIGY